MQLINEFLPLLGLIDWLYVLTVILIGKSFGEFVEFHLLRNTDYKEGYTRYAVLIIGLVVGVFFYLFNDTSPDSLLLSFAIATNMYQLVLDKFMSWFGSDSTDEDTNT